MGWFVEAVNRFDFRMFAISRAKGTYEGLCFTRPTKYTTTCSVRSG